ncbi:84634343-1d61-4294-b6b2-58df4c30d2d7 [Thermothielavioides terrestris]|uniref:84634343-1d61-4294-b6b2-58df4c30d2d7 n=1 Tax=Thermothielavioides terrestris TaxID=2587410 RepID=A0A3S4BF44_9PEZI|nr:84634343-1d61-4294-b6b2-58df4c30d2d7 [Thermothielavioides terrestris]
MALPPKFGGHRLVITDATASGPSANEPLHTLEFYLDYTLTTTVIPHIRSNPALAGRVQLILRQQIQPWHPSSTLVHEAALAVNRLLLQRASSGVAAAEQFWAFSGALFARQTAFFDEAVARETRNETYRRLARLAAEALGDGLVSEADVYGLLEVREGEVGGEGKNAGNAVTADVKTVVKMARLTGVHVSPTVLFNGVVVGEISNA